MLGDNGGEAQRRVVPRVAHCVPSNKQQDARGTEHVAAAVAAGKPPLVLPPAADYRRRRLWFPTRVSSLPPTMTRMTQSPFKYGRDMDGLQGALAALPTAGVYLLGAALAAGLGGAGFAGAEALAPEGVKQAAKYGGAVVGAALGAFLTTQLKAKRESAAIIELANLLVSLSDPTSLQREQVRRTPGPRAHRSALHGRTPLVRVWFPSARLRHAVRRASRAWAVRMPFGLPTPLRLPLVPTLSPPGGCHRVQVRHQPDRRLPRGHQGGSRAASPPCSLHLLLLGGPRRHSRGPVPGAVQLRLRRRPPCLPPLAIQPAGALLFLAAPCRRPSMAPLLRLPSPLATRRWRAARPPSFRASRPPWG